MSLTVADWRARSERDIQIRAGAYIYVYVWRYVCHNSSACHAYVMWVELDHSHLPAITNVVTTGNGTCTKNGTVHFYNPVLSVAATTVAKASYSLLGHGLL